RDLGDRDGIRLAEGLRDRLEVPRPDVRGRGLGERCADLTEDALERLEVQILGLPGLEDPFSLIRCQLLSHSHPTVLAPRGPIWILMPTHPGLVPRASAAAPRAPAAAGP